MSAAARAVLKQALALSRAERAELVAALGETLGDAPRDLSPAARAEIEARIGQLERGEVEPVAWERAKAAIREAIDPGR